MKKKWVCISILLLLSLTACFGYHGIDTDFWPRYQFDADNYVWIADDKTLFLINHNPSGMIGLWKRGSSEYIVFYEYSRYEGRFDAYSDNLLLVDDGNFTINELGGFPIDRARTNAPIFTEDDFSVRITEKESHTILSGVRKLHFTKYMKSDITPSDIGFQQKEWDTVLSEVRYYYRVRWNDDKWGDFYFDDYDGTSSEKYLKFKALLEEGKEDEAMKLVDAFGIQGQ